MNGQREYRLGKEICIALAAGFLGGIALLVVGIGLVEFLKH